MKKLRVGVLGLSHDHVWDNLDALARHSQAELVGAADGHEELRNQFQSRFDCEAFATREELLATHDVDAVYVFDSNAGGAAHAVFAASRGLHVLIEKPMAATLAQADEMLATATEHNVRLMINWPFAWWPQLQHALRVATDGTIGDVWQVKYRAAHAGPQELGCSEFFCDWLFDPERNGGGGALMDYCCYGACLARVLLGRPHSVTGVMGQFCKESISVEDNALIVMTWPRAMATAEASWTQIGKLTSYTTAIYGTKGTLLVEPRDGGRLLLANEDQPEGSGIPLPAPDAHLRDSASHFVDGIQTGNPFQDLCRADVCRDTQEILEAGLQSARQGTRIDLSVGAA